MYFCTVNENSKVMICTINSAHWQQPGLLESCHPHAALCVDLKRLRLMRLSIQYNTIQYNTILNFSHWGTKRKETRRLATVTFSDNWANQTGQPATLWPRPIWSSLQLQLIAPGRLIWVKFGIIYIPYTLCCIHTPGTEISKCIVQVYWFHDYYYCRPGMPVLILI